jgi:cellulose synthase/poly-beta-1,6-N-acetylglucosamine synthase-like glycosyltransferase
MEGSDVPPVDVLIVCCGEENDTIMDTVRAATRIDWPNKKLRVVLCDDQRKKHSRLDEEIHKLKKQLKKGRRKRMFYSHREIPDGYHHGHKAGNVNQTIKYFLADLPGGPADFIMVLDCDMIPAPGILRALMPHFFQGDNMRIGMVTCPQVRTFPPPSA